MKNLIFHQIRDAAFANLSHSKLIKVNNEKLALVAKSIEISELNRLSSWEAPYHLDYSFTADTTEREFKDYLNNLVDFVFTIDTINFGCGYSRDWKKVRGDQGTYATVASALVRRFNQDKPLTSHWGATVTLPEIAEMLGVDPEFELAKLFTLALNQIGKPITELYGSYFNFLNSLSEDTAHCLITEVCKIAPFFQDNHPQPFYKRAQILAHDLYLALAKARSFKPDCQLANFSDIHHLTMFADNLVPHVLKELGALSYSENLQKLIDCDCEISDCEIRNCEIAQGSPEELALRSAGIVGVELLTKELKALHPKLAETIYPAKVDVYLWNLGQERRFKDKPRHLTKCVYY